MYLLLSTYISLSINLSLYLPFYQILSQSFSQLMFTSLWLLQSLSHSVCLTLLTFLSLTLPQTYLSFFLFPNVYILFFMEQFLSPSFLCLCLVFLFPSLYVISLSHFFHLSSLFITSLSIISLSSLSHHSLISLSHLYLVSISSSFHLYFISFTSFFHLSLNSQSSFSHLSRLSHLSLSYLSLFLPLNFSVFFTSSNPLYLFISHSVSTFLPSFPSPRTFSHNYLTLLTILSSSLSLTLPS